MYFFSFLSFVRAIQQTQKATGMCKEIKRNSLFEIASLTRVFKNRLVAFIASLHASNTFNFDLENCGHRIITAG
jgi:hypothetical protein